jgi:hypothetical protein
MKQYTTITTSVAMCLLTKLTMAGGTATFQFKRMSQIPNGSNVELCNLENGYCVGTISGLAAQPCIFKYDSSSNHIEQYLPIPNLQAVNEISKPDTEGNFIALCQGVPAITSAFLFINGEYEELQLPQLGPIAGMPLIGAIGGNSCWSGTALNYLANNSSVRSVDLTGDNQKISNINVGSQCIRSNSNGKLLYGFSPNQIWRSNNDDFVTTDIQNGHNVQEVWIPDSSLDYALVSTISATGPQLCDVQSGQMNVLFPVPHQLFSLGSIAVATLQTVPAPAQEFRLFENTQSRVITNAPSNIMNANAFSVAHQAKKGLPQIIVKNNNEYSVLLKDGKQFLSLLSYLISEYNLNIKSKLPADSIILDLALNNAGDHLVGLAKYTTQVVANQKDHYTLFSIKLSSQSPTNTSSSSGYYNTNQ